MNRDLRKNSRISCSFPVLLRFPDEEPSESWGVIYDIGVDGIELETRRILKQGAVVYFSFTIDRDHAFHNIRTRVTRCNYKKGYTTAGVEFDTSVDRAHIHEAMSVYIESE